MNWNTHIDPAAFAQIQKLLLSCVGIQLTPAKAPMVQSRLARRIADLGLGSYGDYVKQLLGPGGKEELQIAIDLLTTNETYFFREPRHFEFLRDHILPDRPRGRPFRVWSAASSSGEEPYSIAMTLADRLGGEPWEVVASDVSSRVLERARAGHYPLTRTDGIPRDYLRRFCLKGVGRQEGTLLIAPELRNRVRFMQVNLNAPLPELGEFDLIFLRNVMIYFNAETKAEVVRRLLPRLRPGGWLFIGHSESLNGITDAVSPVLPAIYQRAGAEGDAAIGASRPGGRGARFPSRLQRSAA